MAAGIPIIAASKGGLREYLIHGENALLVQDCIHFAEEAQQHLRVLTSDAGLRAKLTANAIQTVQNQFTWHHIAARLQAIYDQL